MAVRNDFTAGEVLAAADLNDTFASKDPSDCASDETARTHTTQHSFNDAHRFRVLRQKSDSADLQADSIKLSGWRDMQHRYAHNFMVFGKFCNDTTVQCC
jgi:hypothetical protein